MFTPYGPANDTCLGIELYEASRPSPPSDFIFSTSLGLLIFMMCTHLSLLPLIWKWRTQSRFYRIRPFFLTWFLQLNLFVYTASSLLPGLTNDHVPCWVLVLGTNVPLAFLTSLFVLRIMTLYLETLYMQSARIHLNKQTATFEETETQSSSALSLTCFKVFPLIADVLFGNIKPEHFLPLELLKIKHSTMFISIIFSSIGWIVCLLILFLVPPYYHGCLQCDFFTEIAIGIFVITFFGICLLIRMVYVTLKVIGTWDKKGVLIEMMLLFTLSGFFFLSGWILVMVDPNNLSYHRKMYWPWFQCINGFLAWFFSCCLQVILQYRENFQRQQIYASKSKLSYLSVDWDSDCLEVIKQNADIKREFENYAESHFILDSLLFLYAVDQFRANFYSKNENLKQVVYKRIVDKFIREGSAYEINVSATQRKTILNPSSISSHQLYAIFDDAYNEVKKMIQQGGWIDFLRYRQEIHSNKNHQSEVSPYL